MQHPGGDYGLFGSTPDLELRIAQGGLERASVLAFMRAQFQQCYGAQIDDDAPVLIGGYDRADSLVAAFALRDGQSGFFCERYLDAPLVDCLGRGLGRPVQPQEVVEVAHLCAIRPGFLCAIMPAAAAALAQRGYGCVVCTATERLAHFFQRKGLVSLTLGTASAERLDADERARWGTYYATRPTVLAGTLAGVPERLAERLLRGVATA